ncbi:MAG: dipeptidase [Breznakia sp.]
MNIIDMHCDSVVALLKRKKAGENVQLFQNDLHIDIKKMQAGKYMLQNFAIFTHLKENDPLIHVQEGIDLYYQEMDKNKNYIRPIYTYKDIETNRKTGHMSAMLTLEEGAVVDNNLAILRNYYRLGVRMITLLWNFPNGIGNPNINMEEGYDFDNFFSYNTKAGLSEFGIAYIKEMERLGIIIDVSHLSDAGFYDVCKYTKKPFVASHSNARSVCSVARNLSDDMIYEIAKRGGVIGINYCGIFLSENKKDEEPSRICDMLKHIRHIKQIGGIDCIGLGSDFDGITSQLEIQDASQMGKLQSALADAGYSDEEIDKICYKNVLRVYKEVL